jgi:branched-chain amino acid transport system ATP-binding protein
VSTACQQHHPYSFAEAVTHLGRWKGREKAIREQSMALLDRVGLADRAEQAAGTLPYGLQRRLEIARALSLEPKLLLLDEPAAGMNPEESRALSALIRGIHDRFALTILLIEHHMDVVMGLCDRIVVINFGALLSEGTPEQVRTDECVLSAYLGKEFRTC